MRVFAAPGKKKAPTKPRPKVVNNIGGTGKNFLSNILGTVVNTLTLPVRLVGSIFKGKGRGKLDNLSGGRKGHIPKKFRALIHPKKTSWWVSAQKRRRHRRGGTRKLRHVTLRRGPRK